jgi:hypothetical protein
VGLFPFLHDRKGTRGFLKGSSDKGEGKGERSHPQLPLPRVICVLGSQMTSYPMGDPSLPTCLLDAPGDMCAEGSKGHHCPHPFSQDPTCCLQGALATWLWQGGHTL